MKSVTDIVAATGAMNASKCGSEVAANGAKIPNPTSNTAATTVAAKRCL